MDTKLPNLAIDPQTTRAIVLTWPDHSLSWEAAAWLYNVFPPENVLGLCMHDLTQARNTAVRELVLKAPAEITDFVLMDRDMRPNELTWPVLQAEGDLVGCTYPVADMRRWSDPTAIHLGLVRVKRRVFEKLDPPWFQLTYNDDGTRRTNCECRYFCRKVIDAGFSVVRTGWCDHRAKT